MNYQQVIEYLYSRLPMFSRIGESAIKKDLTNTLELCQKLGDPHKKFKSIHVAGTNGKGSVSHMLASVLQSAGYKTGLYTSPHLLDFRERIKVNGEMIPEEEVVKFVESQKETIELIQPSFFEVTVGMAFDYFAAQNLDIAVIETGLGGRLDSTNVISPLLSVITNIGYDHMNILGDTLPKIASEKAGIIKPMTPVVISERQPEIADVFLSKAKESGSEIIFASDEWEELQQELKTLSDTPQIVLQSKRKPDTQHRLNLDLKGSYQNKNVKAVLSSTEILQRQGFHISEADLRAGLSEVKKQTGLLGRWQTLNTDPLIICDTGHNEDGIKEVLKNIQTVSYQKLHFVLGMVKDKDISKVLSLLPKEAYYYFTQPQLERAKPSIELAREAAAFGLEGESFHTVSEAVSAAKKNAAKDDFIFIGGSTFVVAEAL